MTTLILLIAMFCGAAISGAIGMGGGVLMLAVMAGLLPPLAVVPLHGAVQLVSNGTRSLRLLRDVNWRFVASYVPLLLFGAFLGVQLYSGENLAWFRPIIGSFVLFFLLWQVLKPKHFRYPQWLLFPAGLVGGLLSVTVGATGPYLAVFFLRDDMERREIVATKATVQTIGHLVKIPAFLSVGFDYLPHWQLIAGLAVTAVVGTLAGTKLLALMGEDKFRIVFRVVLACLALRLLSWDFVSVF